MKMYQVNSEITLSHILPVLENLGLLVMREDNFRLDDLDHPEKVYSIIDLDITPAVEKADLTESRLAEVIECVSSVIENKAHNDAINKLLILADIGFKNIQIIRAYIYYAKQTNFTLSTEYMKQSVI